MAPSAVPVSNLEANVPVSIGENGVGQPDTSNDVNFFDDVHFLGDKEGKGIVRTHGDKTYLRQSMLMSNTTRSGRLQSSLPQKDNETTKNSTSRLHLECLQSRDLMREWLGISH